MPGCPRPRRRLLPALAAGLTALGVLTSCASTDGTGAPQPGPGVAAVVGDHVVTTDLLTQRIRTAAPDLAQSLAAQADPGSGRQGGSPLDPETLADESRELLSTAVLHEVIAEASRREGIVVPPAEVDAQVAAAGGPQAAAGSGYDPATLRELVADQIAVAEIGRREFDRLAVTVDIGTFPTRADAARAADRLATDAGTGALDGLGPDARVLDTTLRPGSVTPGARVRTASSLVFGLPDRTVSISGPPGPPGSPGQPAPDPSTQAWTVVRVRDRDLAAPPPGADAVPAALVDPTTMIQFGLRAVQPLAQQLGVSINPRYGVWDPTQERVAPTAAEAGTVAPLRVAIPVPPQVPASPPPAGSAPVPTPAPVPAP
ncbi:hypothetical protein [Actinomycetospora sp. TBRC 11914]|uniref:hypothetical protein n=1 Tax=Actinomycetospora sp. TBRC 11914 TaxID=2729387 RepID=UPI00145DE3C4|nr:hypothetical protein [Actinomycetospora sp. TBRC 11914]NMO88904.1 hypothetical protein [Actinomycetospora sp. TBRC 11914]